MTTMTDAELVRACVTTPLNHPGHPLAWVKHCDRLTALADALQDGVIVPREPTGAMRIAGISEYEDMTDDRLPDGDGFDEEIISAIYRAMLAASEAK